MFIGSIVAVLVVTGVALGAVAVYRQRHVGRRVRVELTNLGNVESRYQVRAEDPEDSLEFEFSLNGRRLDPAMAPEAVPAAETQPAAHPKPAATPPGQSPYKKPSGVFAAAEGAVGAGGAIAGFLGTIGLLLPRSIGAPLLRMSSQLRGRQSSVARVRAAPMQVGRVARYVPRPLARLRKLRPAGRSSGQAPAAGTAPGSGQAPVASSARTAVAAVIPGWLETPAVLPGDTMSVELLVRATLSDPHQKRSYRVLSRAAGIDDAAPVVEQGSVLFRGGFWTRRFAPYLAILVTAALLLLLAFWLASAGVLA
jgi:hypothetical protein